MSIKKYTSGSWVTVPYKKYETATDTITALPKSIIADGQSASAVIIGNMVQTETPSPQNIIMPDECGDLVTSGEHSGQYQIPILSGGTTTNVYLGELQSTRQIKKLVFDGAEDWTAGGGNSRYIITVDNIQNYAICSHFVFGDSLESGEFDVVPNRTQIRFNNAGYTTLSDFKTYLAQQYANGTPVCVWYVLATPQTATLNEPIRKIGSYSDSVSVTGIPTTGAAESFDIGTTLKPSEVDLTYHGWHEHSDTKF